MIDIGAHLGFFSIMANNLNSQIPIYCFEPFSENFDLLKKNLKENRLKNIHPKKQAVSDKIGETELLISKEDLNHSIENAIEATGKKEKINTTTLEKIFQKNRIEKCNLLKLDCEGSEFKIIYSTPKEIFKKIDHIILEYHDWTANQSSDQLKNYLENLGYRVKKFPNHKMKELGYLWCIKPNTTLL